MAQLVIAAAGAAIGGMIAPGIVAFGMTGGSIGWMAGSMIGAGFGPTQKSEGPRLSDLSVSTSSYGTPIPYVAGSPRVAGQIVWASAKREIATTESAGKGGGGSEYTTYSYEVDLLILLSDNEIDGVTRIWSNGELVYNILSTATDSTISASGNNGLWSRVTVYSGASGQLPDPTYEAAVGTGNAPAYRGRGSVFIQALQLGGQGQIPNLTFEVCRTGTFNTNPFGILPVGVRTKVELRRTGATVELLADGGVVAQSTTYAGNPGGFKNYDIGSFDAVQEFFTGQIDGVRITEGSTEKVNIPDAVYFNGATTTHTGVLCDPGTGDFYAVAYVTPQLDATMRIISAQTNMSDIRPAFWIRREAGGVLRATLINDDSSNTLDISSTKTLITPTSETLMALVSELCLRAGLQAGQFDVSPLSTITQPVRSMAISQVSSARTVLEMLAQCYHFDAVLSDKIYFKPRATASVATLAYSELGVGVDPNADPLPLTTANELEIPAQMALTYNNTGADYQTDIQYSDRLLTGQESTSAITVPLGFTSSEAKQIVDGVLLDKAVSGLTTKVQLGITRAALEPTDVVVITGDDASTYRMRVVKRTESAGVIDLECVLDDSTVFTQSGTTDGGTATQITVLATPTTTLALLDIPLLRDADNKPGFYVAVTGSATNWTSAAIYDSLDDLTYAQVNTMADQTAQGTCTSILGNWAGGNVFDTTNTVTVSVGGGQTLSSVTYDDLLLSQSTNAALIGSELVQYRTATLVSAGVYTLSNFLRGRRGTEWAQTGHASNERFVVLGTSGLRYITLQTVDLGSARYYKAASAGQKLSAVSSQTITPAGISLECFSPVDARANRATTDTVLTWTRRTRLSTRLVGTLPISAPLGEDAESYEVEVWDSGYTTLKRILTASTPTVTYTNANQITDFGSGQTVLYLKIYQLSAIVGRGYPLTVSV